MYKTILLFLGILPLITTSVFSQFSSERLIYSCEECEINSVDAADIDNDGDLDIVTSLAEENSVVWFKNQGNNNFSNPIIISSSIFRASNVVAKDMENDGDIDVLSVSSRNGQLTWHVNDGNGTFFKEIIISKPINSLRHLQVIDLSGNGYADIVYPSFSVGSDYKLMWHKNNGDGDFSEAIIIAELEEYASAIFAEDLDGNGFKDVLITSGREDFITWYKNNGSSFTETAIINKEAGCNENQFSTVPEPIFCLDMDKDGDIDVFCASNCDNKITWYKNDGTGNFTDRMILSNDTRGDYIVEINSFDVDGDDDLDFLSFGSRIDKIKWYENNGNDIFLNETIISSMINNPGSGMHKIIDLDRSGDLDIIFSFPLENKIVWYENLVNHPTIQGNIFWDENENGLLDSFEIPLSNAEVNIQPEALSSYTNVQGKFNFFVSNGTYNITPNVDSCWVITSDSSKYTIKVDDNVQRNINFGFSLVSDFTSIKPRLQSSPTRCDFKVPFVLSLENDGCSPVTGHYGFVIDNLTTFISSDIEPLIKKGDTLIWDYHELFSSEIESIDLILEVAGAEFIGQEIQLTALSYIENEIGELELANTYEYTSEIRCAYDPNDKLVVPNRLADYDQNYTLFEESLEYTIRFQNTGNDTAFNVVITDTLDKNLDRSTFKPILASHPFETLLNSDGAVEFSFKNIFLPDSTTNEPLSHGFVNYKIAPKKDLPENTVIENTANIFFDFNPPIITNTTMNVLVSELPTTTSVNDLAIGQQIKVYPNPFGDFITIEQAIFQFSDLPTLSLFDVTGRQVQSAILTDATQQVSTTHLANGLYFYQVINADGQMTGNGKVVKH